MECWLSIDEQHVAVGEVAMNDFFADLKLISQAVSLFLGHILEQELLASYLVFNHVGSRVHGGSITDEGS